MNKYLILAALAIFVWYNVRNPDKGNNGRLSEYGGYTGGH